MKKVEDILNKLRESDVYIQHIYMFGGCYQLYLILKAIFPAHSTPYISKNKDHVITKIYGHFYDITGEVNGSDYSLLADDEVEMVSKWSFSKIHVLQLTECPHCGEPIIYNDNPNNRKHSN